MSRLQGNPSASAGAALRRRYPTRRNRLFRLRWRSPRLTTDEARELAEAAAVRHDGDLVALIGELVAAAQEHGDFDA